MKDAGIFLGHTKIKLRDFFRLQKRNFRRDFFGYAKESGDFFG